MRKLWLHWRSSLWFIPTLLVLSGVTCAVVLIEVDTAFANSWELERWRPFVNASAEGAREMLGAIASSSITVAGVAFSITVVTLSLASTQYTPRILRNFMRDRANQWVLGLFVSIFAYCLIVLRTVYASDDTRPAFVPLIAVTFAVFLAILSIGCLIFFIHHTATSIQASHILETISNETLAVLRDLCPEESDEGDQTDSAKWDYSDGWHPMTAKKSGYLQHVEASTLSNFVTSEKVTLRICRTVGDFIMPGLPILHASRPLDEHEQNALHEAFVTGDFRTVDQDPSFGVRQIVDIALKALSPGINDSSTAISCLDYLGAILGEMGSRRLLSPLHCAPGAVFAPETSFEAVASTSFDEIRLWARANVPILVHELRVLERLLQVLPSKHRAILLHHAAAIAETADHGVAGPYDRRRINDALHQLRLVATVDGSANSDPNIPALIPIQSGAQGQ